MVAVFTITALISGLWNLLMTHSMQVVVEAAAVALGRMARFDFARSREVEAELRKALPTLCARVIASSDDEVDLAAALYRLKCVSASMDAASMCEELAPRGRTTTALISLLRARTQSDGAEDELSPEVLTFALDTLFSLFSWCFVAIQQIAARVDKSGHDQLADTEAVKSLRAAVTALLPLRDNVVNVRAQCSHFHALWFT